MVPGKFSHEFQTITGAGEDTIYIDENKGFAINKEVFTDEIAKQSGNAEIYRAAVEFYIDTKQEEKVSPLLNACTSDTVLEALKDYVSGAPEFSLD